MCFIYNFYVCIFLFIYILIYIIYIFISIFYICNLTINFMFSHYFSGKKMKPDKGFV